MILQKLNFRELFASRKANKRNPNCRLAKVSNYTVTWAHARVSIWIRPMKEFQLSTHVINDKW